MPENLEFPASNLLCAENTSTWGDLDCDGINRLEISNSISISISPPLYHKHNQTHDQGSFLNNRSGFLMGFDFPVPSEEMVREMVEREVEHLPRDDYLKRLRRGDLDMSSRREAVDWIMKACAHYHFGPLSVCLSVNYLDRFLSFYELPKGKSWTVQLLAVACLSIAAKLEETKVPLSVDFQVGDPKYLFEAKTIQRMELMVLNTLMWKMQAFTPCSFIDHFLSKIRDDQNPSPNSISRSIQLILSIMRGIDFLEFRPSEISAAIAISVSGAMQAVEIDKSISKFLHVSKEKVLKCVELMNDLCLFSNPAAQNALMASIVPQSPNGVLEAACWSYKSDDITTVGSCATTSSFSSQENKRRKHDHNYNNNNNKPPPFFKVMKS